MQSPSISCKRHRFPDKIITDTFWLWRAVDRPGRNFAALPGQARCTHYVID
ncbi:MAG: hypothetical protein ABJY83_06610 [Roseibium sp.]